LLEAISIAKLIYISSILLLRNSGWLFIDAGDHGHERKINNSQQQQQQQLRDNKIESYLQEIIGGWLSNTLGPS